MANLIDLKGFACHWRFVTRSQQLCSKSFLLLDMEISSFSLSRPLLKCFNRQASKRNNLVKERVANVSLGVVEGHVTCPSWILQLLLLLLLLLLFIFFVFVFVFFFFDDQNSFMATILQLKVDKRRLLKK